MRIENTQPADTGTMIEDVAIIFEGGGMRGAHTAPVVAELIREGINFPFVSGVSAGASHTMNFVSRDAARAHDTFVNMAGMPECGGLGYWARGEGLFNVDYIYRRIAHPDGDFPFNIDTFHANPAQVQIATFNATRAQVRWFDKSQMETIDEVGRAVRASSTLPLLMPAVEMEGDQYVDGALGPNAGIAVDAAIRAGYKKFLIVLTRPRAYIKGGLRPALDLALRAAYKDLPSIRDGVRKRPARYNAARRTIFELEARGQAYVYAPEQTTVSSTEMNVDRLEAAYQLGLEQVRREMPALKRFLNL